MPEVYFEFYSIFAPKNQDEVAYKRTTNEFTEKYLKTARGDTHSFMEVLLQIVLVYLIEAELASRRRGEEFEIHKYLQDALKIVGES
ncbi:MAG: hypothetical protein ACFFBD_27520 [Candidatus Hodarchaeota archaeon]